MSLWTITWKKGSSLAPSDVAFLFCICFSRGMFSISQSDNVNKSSSRAVIWSHLPKGDFVNNHHRTRKTTKILVWEWKLLTFFWEIFFHSLKKMLKRRGIYMHTRRHTHTHTPYTDNASPFVWSCMKTVSNGFSSRQLWLTFYDHSYWGVSKNECQCGPYSKAEVQKGMWCLMIFSSLI